MSFDAHKNFAYGLVATPPSPALSGTSLTLGTGYGALMPAVPFNATVWPVGELALSASAEVVRVTARAGDVLTIVREQEGSTARTILVGDQFAATITAKTLTDIEDATVGGAGGTISAGTASVALGQVVFSNSGGVSFGLNGSTLTATVKTDYLTTAQPVGAYLTTAMASNRGSDFIAASAGVNLTGSIGATLGSGSVSFSIPAFLTTAQAPGNYLTTAMASNRGSDFVAASAGVNLTGSIGATLGSGSVSFSIPAFLTTAALSADSSKYAATGFTTTTAGGSVIAGTHDTVGLKLGVPAFLTTAQAPGAYLTTAMASNRGSDFVNATAGVNLTGSIGATLGSGSVSFSIPAFLTTAMLSNASTISNVNVSGGTTSSNLSAFKLIDSNGVSWSLDTGSKVYATVKTDYLTSQSNQAFSAAGGSSAFQTLAFGDTNQVSWTNTNGSVGIASIKLSMFAVSNTTQSTNGTANHTALSFAGAGIASVGISGGSVVISVPTGAPSPVNFSAGTTSSNLGSVVFSDASGVSWGLNGATITASVKTDYLTTAMQSNAATISNLRVSGGTTSNLLSALTFADSNRISFGLNASTLTMKHALNFSAGTTSNDVSDQLIFSNSNGISFGLNASTITAQGPIVSSFQNIQAFNTSALTFGQTSLSQAVAFLLPLMGSFSFLRIPALMTTNSTTIATLASATATASGALYSTLNAVVYSLGTGANSKSLQSVTSGSAGFTMQQSISITNSTQASYTLAISGQALGGGTTLTTQYSISNTNYSFTTDQIATGFSTGRFLDVPFAASLSAGAYWLVIGMSTSSASGGAAGLAALTNCNVRYSNHYGASQANVGFGIFGSTNMSSGGQLGNGFFSTAGGGTTNSIPISAISSTASNPIPLFQLLRSN